MTRVADTFACTKTATENRKPPSFQSYNFMDVLAAPNEIIACGYKHDDVMSHVTVSKCTTEQLLGMCYL